MNRQLNNLAGDWNSFAEVASDDKMTIYVSVEKSARTTTMNFISHGCVVSARVELTRTQAETLREMLNAAFHAEKVAA